MASDSLHYFSAEVARRPDLQETVATLESADAVVALGKTLSYAFSKTELQISLGELKSSYWSWLSRDEAWKQKFFSN